MDYERISKDAVDASIYLREQAGMHLHSQGLRGFELRDGATLLSQTMATMFSAFVEVAKDADAERDLHATVEALSANGGDTLKKRKAKKVSK